MQLRARKIGPAQVGFVEVGAGKLGAAEPRARKLSIVKIGAPEIGATQIGARKVTPLEIDAGKIAMRAGAGFSGDEIVALAGAARRRDKGGQYRDAEENISSRHMAILNEKKISADFPA
jgi:hypothetical protein